MAIFVAMLLGGSFLVRWLLHKLPPARIGLEVLTTGISFDARPAPVGQLFSTLDTRKLYLSKFGKIDLGRGRVEMSSSARWPAGETSIKAKAGATATISPASIAEIDPAPHADKVRVLLAWEEAEPRSLRIAIDSVDSLRLSPAPKLQLTCTDCSSSAGALPKQASFVFTSDDPLGHETKICARAGSLGLGADLIAPDQFRIRSVPVAGRLAFERSGEEGRPVSSIREGTLVLSDVGKPVKIAASALIHLKGLSGFQVNDIYFKADGAKLLGLEVAASGDVEEMSIDGRDVLPGYFARLTTPEWLTAILTFALVVFAAVDLVLKGRRKSL